MIPLVEISAYANTSSVRVELGPLLKKKGVVCMECKVRYFLTQSSAISAEYILILFIVCSRECHAKKPRFLSCS